MPHFPPKQIDHVENPVEDEEEENDRAQRIRIKNRRKRYLDLHPEYFESSHLELAGRSTLHPFHQFLTISPIPILLPIPPADPLLYDRLIRRFQSAEEREREGRERGYSGVLEANLVRSEAKIDALQHPDPNSPMIYTRAPDGSIVGVEQDEDERVVGKDEGWERWKDVMGLRFLRGGDAEFEYADVDESEEFDDRGEEDREKLELWLDGQSEEFVGDGKPVGETGVQDF